MRTSRAAAVAVISLVSIAWTAGSAGAQTAPGPQRTWAAAATATIHPGVQTVTDSGQCTANFVFYDAYDVYLGQAAHCSSAGLFNEINGCETEVLPLGTQVQIEGATQVGHIVYNSWQAMQVSGERSEATCYGNDFALVRLDPADQGRVNPSVPYWGGPNGLDGTSSGGEPVYGYGNSPLRLGLSALSPQYGFGVSETNEDWTHVVYVVTPGIPGDSGSAYLGEGGAALGILSTVSALGSNQLTDLARALSFMRDHSDLDAVQLANGTEEFSPLI